MLNAFLSLTLVASLLLPAAPMEDDGVPAPKPSTTVQAGGPKVDGKTSTSSTVRRHPKKTTPPPTTPPSSPPTPPKKPHKTKLPALKTKGPHCGANTDICDPAPKKKTTTAKTAPSNTQLREVVAKLRLPDPTPRLGPDPSVNEWNMLAVGYPIWLWTDQPTHLATTAHHDGLTFTLNAQLVSTAFNMGDHNTKYCAATTPYPGYTRNTSPTCSYTYEDPSPIGHPYTLTATTTWNITWHTTGHNGTLTHTTTGTRTLEVGELQSLITGG